MNLTSHPSFPDRSLIRETIQRLELPEQIGDFCGVRLHAWLVPPVTGQYRFWIAADDSGELWLEPR